MGAELERDDLGLDRFVATLPRNDDWSFQPEIITLKVSDLDSIYRAAKLSACDSLRKAAREGGKHSENYPRRIFGKGKNPSSAAVRDAAVAVFHDLRLGRIQR